MTSKIVVPSVGKKITVNPDHSLNVPDEPIIPFIEGDGIGADITPVMIKVVDAAVKKAYGGRRKISWMEIFCGEKSTKIYGPDVWLPEETLAVLQDYVVSIKGPPDHAGGRWHPLIECGPAPAARSLCLPAASPLLQGGSESPEGT